MVFRSFSKLHPNGPVPHQISPPNSHFINPVQAFLALLTCPNHTLGEAPPSDTANHHFWPEPPSQKTCLFHPAAGESHPSRLRASISSQVTGECLPATQLYLSVFTCPTVSLDLPSDAGASPPARRPYLFHPTAGEAYPSRPRVFSSGRMSARASWPHNLPFCLYLSNTASLDLPLDAGESLPARQPYLSNLLLDEAYPSDTAILNHSWTSARALPARQSYLFKSTLDKAYPSDTAVLKPQSDVGESLPARQSYFSKS